MTAHPVARTAPSTGRRIRVCVLISFYPPEFTGHGIQLQQNLPHFESRGIEVTVVSTRLPEGQSEAHPQVARPLSRRSSPWLRLRRIAELRRFLSRHRHDFDIVHSSMQSWDFVLNVPFLKSLGLPIVYEMILKNDPSTMRSSSRGRLKAWLLRGVDAWVGLSGTFGPRVEAAGIPRERFHVAYGGVDSERYRPRDATERRELRRRLEIPEESRVVVSVGSIIPRKGMDRVVEGWARTRPEPGRDLLLLVGPYDFADRQAASRDDFVATLRRRIEEPDLAGTVRLEGHSDRPEEYLGAADIFLFLSRKEGLGYVTLEAMASGLPAVVSPMDGIGAELVGEGTTGHIVEEPDDPEAVRRALAALLDHPERRAEMGRRGRERVLERFSMEARVEVLERIYRSLVPGASGA